MYEILAPAGNRECALAAIDSGADAIYLGYAAFSARAGAENFDLTALGEIIAYAHLFGVKIYVAMNTLVKDNELEDFLSALVKVHNLGADAILLQDIFLGKFIHARYPDIVLHLSTQAGVNNVYGAWLAKEYGFSRVVLARETSLREIKAVSSVIETEVFVQGALCTCFSGQCYLSSFAGGSSGNRGRCKQPCRKKYFYDTGEQKLCYALSLSDLSVGESLDELAGAGVYSFKIEGRMRRPEYVAAAVRYYKKILARQNADRELSDLKRTYNRGNYTKGLAFGQDKRLLSPSVQGHIGEKVGVLKIVGGKYYVASSFRPAEGGGFKILRQGVEVGGGSFLSADRQGFYLSSRARLKNGDGVFLTTDTALGKRLLSEHRKKPLEIELSAAENAPLCARCGAVRLCSDFIAESAKNSPLRAEELRECFLKTDGLPFDVSVNVCLSGSCFVPKSRLNAFRRDFFAALWQSLTANGNIRYDYNPVSFDFPVPMSAETKKKRAVIGTDFKGIEADIYICKPSDYADDGAYEFDAEAGEKFLYLPAFLSDEDLQSAKKHIGKFDGIYAEGTYGILCAREWGKKLFAGTGFNLTNACAVTAAMAEGAYYALSKELNFAEQKPLAGGNAFVLSAGDVKVMDLIYCPFGKKCSACEKRDRYTLTDEEGRKFPVRRYRASGNCRFELFNCAPLNACQDFANALIDISALPVSAAKGVVGHCFERDALKEILPKSTAGHSRGGVL